jgi:hypothetical protein
MTQTLTNFPGFALIAAVASLVDPVPSTPEAALVVYPPVPVVGQPILLFWSAINVASVELTTSDGFSSGVINASANSGIILLPNGFSNDAATVTLVAYDAQGNVVLQGAYTLTPGINFRLSISATTGVPTGTATLQPLTSN